MPVYKFGDAAPKLAADTWIAPSADVIGDVHLGAGSSVWFGTVIRGDVFHIRIGDLTNIQDNSVIHVTTDKYPTLIGNGVTVGHKAILHGCKIEDGCLIGMGAIVMDRAVIGEGAFVAAGALVSEGTVIPPRTLAMGIPARPKRELTDEEVERLGWAASHYKNMAATYAKDLGWGQVGPGIDS